MMDLNDVRKRLWLKFFYDGSGLFPDPSILTKRAAASAKASVGVPGFVWTSRQHLIEAARGSFDVVAMSSPEEVIETVSRVGASIPRSDALILHLGAPVNREREICFGGFPVDVQGLAEAILKASLGVVWLRGRENDGYASKLSGMLGDGFIVIGSSSCETIETSVFLDGDSLSCPSGGVLAAPDVASVWVGMKLAAACRGEEESETENKKEEKRDEKGTGEPGKTDDRDKGEVRPGEGRGVEKHETNGTGGEEKRRRKRGRPRKKKGAEPGEESA